MKLLTPNASEVLSAEIQTLMNKIDSIYIKYPIKITVSNKGNLNTLLMSIRLNVNIYGKNGEMTLSDMNMPILQGGIQEIKQWAYINISNDMAKPVIWHYIFNYFDVAAKNLLGNTEPKEAFDLIETFLKPPTTAKGVVDTYYSIFGAISFSIECVDHLGNIARTQQSIPYVKQ